MIANADKDGTGTLDLIEFLQMMKEKIREQNKEEEIGEAFRVFDIVSHKQMYSIERVTNICSIEGSQKNWASDRGVAKKFGF